MCCPKGIAKCFLYVFNALFLLMGIITLALGIVVLLDDSTIKEAFSYIPSNDIASADDLDSVLDGISFLDSACYAVIALGSLLFILAFLAICGAMKHEGKCGKIMLFIYGFIVLLFLVIEIAVAVFSILYSREAQTYLKTYLHATITYYYNGVALVNDIPALNTDIGFGGLITTAWDLVQIKFDCCGASGVSDYASPTPSWDSTVYSFGGSAINPAVVPPSCCIMTGDGSYPNGLSGITITDGTNCMTSATTASTNTTGCFDSIFGELKALAWYLVGGLGGFAFCQFCALCAAFRLIHLGRKNQVGEYA